MKSRHDIYINGQRLPIRLNGYVGGLVAASNEGITHAATAALCAFLRCDESTILANLDAFCAEHDVTRSWLIEHLLAVRLAWPDTPTGA